MPTLLLINATANYGSTGKIAEQIGSKATEAGWNCYMAYGRFTCHSRLQVTKVGNNLSVLSHFCQNRMFDREGLGSVNPTRKLIRKIKKINPDVIHLHNIHDHWLNYKLLFKYINSTDIKVVWTFHDCWAFTGHCCHFVSAKCDRWKTLCHDCPMRVKALFDRSEKNYLLKKSLFNANNNLTIVPCSDWLGDFIKESFLKAHACWVIHNGIDLNVFKPSGVESSVGKHRIIAVSNVWLRYKGINDLYELRELLPEDYELVIVGLPAAQMDKLPQGIVGIQKTQNVQQLVELYSSADVLVNPTYADTFPTVNLEALACGTPVVTYRTGGSPEAVDARTGIVVEQGNLDALCKAVIKICENGKGNYADACRKRAEELFDKDKCFSQYINLYNSLI